MMNSRRERAKGRQEPLCATSVELNELRQVSRIQSLPATTDSSIPDAIRSSLRVQRMAPTISVSSPMDAIWPNRIPRGKANRSRLVCKRGKILKRKGGVSPELANRSDYLSRPLTVRHASKMKLLEHQENPIVRSFPMREDNAGALTAAAS